MMIIMMTRLVMIMRRTIVKEIMRIMNDDDRFQETSIMSIFIRDDKCSKAFLDASLHPYNLVGPFIGLSVDPSRFPQTQGKLPFSSKI